MRKMNSGLFCNVCHFYWSFDDIGAVLCVIRHITGEFRCFLFGYFSVTANRDSHQDKKEKQTIVFDHFEKISEFILD